MTFSYTFRPRPSDRPAEWPKRPQWLDVFTAFSRQCNGPSTELGFYKNLSISRPSLLLFTVSLKVCGFVKKFHSEFSICLVKFRSIPYQLLMLFIIDFPSINSQFFFIFSGITSEKYNLRVSFVTRQRRKTCCIPTIHFTPIQFWFGSRITITKTEIVC